MLPFLFQELKTNHGDWFPALTAITGANPIVDADAGNIDKMAESWLAWAK